MPLNSRGFGIWPCISTGLQEQRSCDFKRNGNINLQDKYNILYEIDDLKVYFSKIFTLIGIGGGHRSQKLKGKYHKFEI